MGLRVTPANITPVNISEGHGFVPPPTGSAEPEKVVDDEPLNFPPMVKDDELSAKSPTEEKPVVVARREAVPKVDGGPVPSDFPDVGIDFGAEGDPREKQSTSGRAAKIADAGSFEKNFEQYLRKKNDGRTEEQTEGPSSEVTQVGFTEPDATAHDVFSDDDKKAGSDSDTVQGTTTDATSLVPGILSNPGVQKIEEARRKIEEAQISAFRETQGDFRSGIGASDKYLEDTFKTFKMIMNEGMLGKSADEARNTLLKQHEELQTSLNRLPGQAFKENLAARSRDYLTGDKTPEQKSAILEGMYKLGAPVVADKLKLFGDTLATAGLVLNQEAQVKQALQKAVSESYNMRTMYGESIYHAMEHQSTSPEQKELDLQEIAKLSEEQRMLQERFDAHMYIPPLDLELRVRKNVPGMQDARVSDSKQIA